jgi:hypothetical protein
MKGTGAPGAGGAPGGTDTEARLLPKEVLASFERDFDPARPEADPRVRVVGYGEISMVFALESHPDVVIKRLAGFRSDAEVQDFAQALARYVRALRSAGVRALRTEVTGCDRGPGRHVVFMTQPRLEARTLGQAVLRDGDDHELAQLLREVVFAVGRVARTGDSHTRLGLDAQISNWAASEDGAPLYIDVSTPFMRCDGVEVLDLAPILRAAPLGLGALLAWTGKAQSMVDRYYSPRLQLVDIVGNFIKEGRSDRVAASLSLINEWLASEDGLPDAAPITEAEVRADYASDARMWAALQALKRPDRFLRQRLLRRPYDFVLMPKVERGL